MRLRGSPQSSPHDWPSCRLIAVAGAQAMIRVNAANGACALKYEFASGERCSGRRRDTGG